MALLMRRCFCCDLRTGSIVVAIWSLFLSVASVAETFRAIAIMVGNDAEIPAQVWVMWVFMILLNVGLFVTSILLLLGILKESRGFFAPFLVFTGLIVASYVVLIIALIVFLVTDISYFNFLGLLFYVETPEDVRHVLNVIKIVYSVTTGALAVGVFIEVVCLLCVFSKYKVLGTGRSYQDPIESPAMYMQRDEPKIETQT